MRRASIIGQCNICSSGNQLIGSKAITFKVFTKIKGFVKRIAQSFCRSKPYAQSGVAARTIYYLPPHRHFAKLFDADCIIWLTALCKKAAWFFWVFARLRGYNYRCISKPYRS
jgi:hypothetical protein